MTKPKSKNIPQFDKTQPIFLGIDVHKKNWNISLVHCDQLFFRSSIPGNFEHLWKILKRYSECKIYSVYEAGFSGFHLHFQLTEAGIENIVTPPNKIPIVVGDKVKTDKRDSFKLANFLAKNLLKAIHIPSQELIQVRQLLRTRQQFSRKKVSAMNQIKSLLIQFGTQLPTFSDRLLKSLKKMDLAPNMQLSINYQVELIELLNKQMNFLKKEALTFANRKKYKEDYKRLLSVPGIGPITGIALLFEIGDWARFPNEKSISAFLGLTPSEYSSGEHSHRGRITGQGNAWLRSLLIEVSWGLIKKDGAMAEAFNRISSQTGSKKKAIVAIARKLICRIHSMMKNNQEYVIGLVV